MATKKENQTAQNDGNDEVDFMSLGIVSEQETDRYKIGDTKETLEPLRITRMRFDKKTRYYNEEKDTGAIVKIDGISMNDTPVKLFSLSDVLYKQCKEIIEAVGGIETTDDNKNEWFELKKKVRIGGFELVKTEKGKNPYVKIKTTG